MRTRANKNLKRGPERSAKGKKLLSDRGGKGEGQNKMPIKWFRRIEQLATCVKREVKKKPKTAAEKIRSARKIRGEGQRIHLHQDSSVKVFHSCKRRGGTDRVRRMKPENAKTRIKPSRRHVVRKGVKEDSARKSKS